MAKSKSGGSRAYIRGRVGSDVYSIGKDGKGKKQQVVRSLAEQVANPQTQSQMRGRMIMSTVMQAVSAMAMIIDHSFDNVAVGQPNISEFISQNYGLIKADVIAHPASGNAFGLNQYKEKGIKQGAYIVSAGSGANLGGATIDGSSKVVTLAIGGDMKISDLKAALGISADDFFTVVSIDPTAGFVYARFHLNSALADDTVIAAGNVESLFTVEGNVNVTPAVSGTNVTLTFATLTANAGIITSHLVAGGFKHNSVTLAAPTNPAYNADAALPTYPVGAQRFLNGGDSSFNGGGGNTPTPTPVTAHVLTIQNTSGKSASVVNTETAQAIASGSSVEDGTSITVSMSPADVSSVQASFNGSPISFNASGVAILTMPSANASLVITSVAPAGAEITAATYEGQPWSENLNGVTSEVPANTFGATTSGAAGKVLILCGAANSKVNTIRDKKIADITADGTFTNQEVLSLNYSTDYYLAIVDEFVNNAEVVARWQKIYGTENDPAE